MEFIVIKDLTDVTEEKLLEAMKKNANTASLCREQIRKMKAAAAKTKKVVPIPNIEEYQTDSVTIEDEDKANFEDEIEYYISSMKEITADNIDSEIEDVLPVRKNPNYRTILYRLKLEALRNIREIEELFEEADETEDLTIFKDEVILEQRKISYIDKSLTQQKSSEVTQEQEEKNNIVFVPTSGGSIRVLDEMERIPQEYQAGFKELFDSIQDGTFKGIKKFKNNNALNGIIEVKGFQVRVVFARLNKNTYALITAFIKKCDNDNGYVSVLKQKVADYRTISEQLKKNLSNPEFMDQQREYKEELYRLLGEQDSKGTSYVKGAK